MTVQLVITPGGVTRCIYSEQIDLTALGSPTISRAATWNRTSTGVGWWICHP